MKKSPELVCSTILSRQPHATEVKKESKVYWGFFIQMSKSWLIDHSYLSKKSDDILYSSTLYLLLRLPHSHIVPTILTFCYNHFQGHRCKLLEIKKYKILSLTQVHRFTNSVDYFNKCKPLKNVLSSCNFHLYFQL